jgi:transposase, IS30 family
VASSPTWCRSPNGPLKRRIGPSPGTGKCDLILGRASKSQIVTIVERTTPFTLLVRLPEDREAVTVRDAVALKIVGLPEQLRRSLTWDQGKEMAAHVSFSVAL